MFQEIAMALVQECDFPEKHTEWQDLHLDEFMRDSVHGRALFSATPMDTGTDWLPNARFVRVKNAAHLKVQLSQTCHCMFFAVKRPPEEQVSSPEGELLEQDRGTAPIFRPHVDLL
jgi:hypothetical protein